MNEKKSVKRVGHKNCCVVQCNNRYENTVDVVFYSFPGQPWEKEKREKWIQAVNRKNQDGTKWLPTANSFICSKHFIGNCKSQHPLNPSYLPTIFPEVYKKPQLTDSQKSRFSRVQDRAETLRAVQENVKRSRIENEESEAVGEAAEHNPRADEEPIVRSFKDACTQTDPMIVDEECVAKSEPMKLPSKPVMVDKEVSAVDGSLPNEPGTFLHCSGFHGYSSVAKDESAMSDLAGVTLAVFALILNFLPNTEERKVTKENKLLIFLMKMKTGFTYSSLRVLFGVHRTTVANIFKNVLSQLTAATMSFVFWPSQTSVRNTMPVDFKLNYPKCRVIIDCSEIRVEQPKEVDNRIYFYSNYKSAFTMKFLIGITPSGMVSFISKCYGGRSSDSSITVDSKLLDLLEPDDDVMADKGFPGIKSTIEEKHCVIVMPPFLHNGRFSAEEVDSTYRVASVRIHVERMIQRVKIYNILQKVPVELFPHIDDIVRMCCVLANLQLPIIKQI